MDNIIIVDLETKEFPVFEIKEGIKALKKDTKLYTLEELFE